MPAAGGNNFPVFCEIRGVRGFAVQQKPYKSSFWERTNHSVDARTLGTINRCRVSHSIRAFLDPGPNKTSRPTDFLAIGLGG